MKKRVFVVQNQHRQGDDGNLVPKFDLSPASEHGQIVYLLSPTARPYNTESILLDLHTKLCDYDPRTDHLLLIGNPFLIGLAVAVAIDYGGGSVQVLQWDGRRRSYVSLSATNVC